MCEVRYLMCFTFHVSLAVAMCNKRNTFCFVCFLFSFVCLFSSLFSFHAVKHDIQVKNEAVNDQKVQSFHSAQFEHMIF